jgi:uncharacterized repeat protein (TIGR01451 family)
MKRPPRLVKRGLKIESLESRLALAVDLAVDVSDGDIEAHPGDTVVYRLEYANHGDTDATGVTLGDLVLPRATFNAEDSTDGWDCGMAEGPAFIHCKLDVGDLAAGATGVAELAVDVPDDAGGGGGVFGNALANIRAANLLWNFARISDDGANGRDANPRNNHDVERTPVVRPRIVADLKIEVSDGDATAALGGSVQYTIDYANGGTGDATGVVIRQILPAFTRFDAANSSEGWTCTPALTANSLFGHGNVCTLEVGALAAGAEDSATLGVTVAAEVPRHVTQLTTTASISTRAFHIDPTPQNNFDTEQTPIAHPPAMAPELSITSDDGDVTVGPGDTLTYTLSYANNGTAEATGVVLTEIVPAFTRFNAEASSEGWRCNSLHTAAGVNSSLLPAICVLDVGSLAPNATGTATFAVTVGDRLPSSLRAIRNLARIRDDGSHGRDPNPHNNSATNETPIERPAPKPGLNAVRR